MASVEYLDISKNKIGDAIIVDIIKQLSSSSDSKADAHKSHIRRIKFLNFSSTQISDSSILSLQSIFDCAPQLPQNPKIPPLSLLKLDISSNNITENGLTYLADLITQKRLISHLNISNSTMLSEDFLDSFLSILRENSSLLCINYSKNKI